MLLHMLLLFRPPPAPLSNRDEKGANALQEGTHVTSKLAFLRYATPPYMSAYLRLQQGTCA